MIRLLVKKYIKPEYKSAYLKLVKKLIEETRKEKGCVEYYFNHNDEDNVAFFIELWEDSHSLENHKNSEHMKKYIPLLNEMCDTREKEVEEYIYYNLF
ncbi:putative quinol monooxygenase [uncultured Fusobacterium sp.]|uniref:putative quinol monooxygenase n=1 Tax=uncultured Fusobacterium sp. TaxID=159267 RepID=UPI0025D40981|nr:putative quinol monooxygenase [uncultured Fusobacterium sp.]